MEEVFRSDAQEREITLSDFLLQVCMEKSLIGWEGEYGIGGCEVGCGLESDEGRGKGCCFPALLRHASARTIHLRSFFYAY